jgi:hypothetical protein
VVSKEADKIAAAQVMQATVAISVFSKSPEDDGRALLERSVRS